MKADIRLALRRPCKAPGFTATVVLLIACVNLAGLTLVHAIRNQGEVAQGAEKSVIG